MIAERMMYDDPVERLRIAAAVHLFCISIGGRSGASCDDTGEFVHDRSGHSAETMCIIPTSQLTPDRQTLRNTPMG